MSSGNLHDGQLGEQLSQFLGALRQGTDVAASPSPANQPNPADGSSSASDQVRQYQNVVGHLDALARTVRDNTPLADVPKSLDKYQVIRCVGQGGQSLALLAFDPDLKRLVVIKLYHAAKQAAARQSILDEGRTLSLIDSPNVVRCYAVDRHDDAPYLVLEYIPGSNLADLLAAGPLPVQQAIKLGIGLAKGLETIHATGLVHRDIKPGNIVVTNQGTPKWIDFGIASSSLQTQQQQRQGTPRYYSPEQARGTWEQVDQRSDLFGFGAVLYEMLSGLPIYDGEERDELVRQALAGEIRPLNELRPDVPLELHALCMQCLAKYPLQRPASARIVVEELQKLRAPQRGRSSRLLVIAATLLLVCGGLLWRSWNPISAPSKPVKPGPSISAGANGETYSHSDPSKANQPNWSRAYEIAQTAGRTTIPLEQQLGMRDDFPIHVLHQPTPDAASEPVDGSRPLSVAVGDTLSLSVQAQQTCYLYVYSVEFSPGSREPHVEKLFPHQAGENNQLLADQPVQLPKLLAVPQRDLEFLYCVARSEPQREDRRYRGLRRPILTSERLIRYHVQPRDEHVASQ